MANKKISELTTRTPSLSDLILVGDPSNGFSYKCTVTALATIIETDIADGYVTLGTTQTISGAKTFSNNLTLTSVANATTDPDKFLVLNGSNIVNYRTGSEVLSDIGGQATISLTTTGTSGAATFTSNTLNIPQYQGAITLTTTGTSGAATLVGNTLNIPNYAPDLSGYVPTTRTITINGTTQDLSANRTYNVGTVTSVAASAGTGISISGSPITSSGTITITNTAPDQVVALTAGTGISISGTYPNFTITNSSPSLGGTVTSVALSAPTGFAVTGSPITSSGTLALAFDTGYSLPTTASQTNWDSAYNNMIISAAVTGTSTKTLTLTQQDTGTITATWTDDNSGTVTSVGLTAPTGFAVTNTPVTTSGTIALAFAAGYSLPTTASQTNWDTAYNNRITSLTTTGSSGSATLVSNTLNIPTYTLAGLGGISLSSLSATLPLGYNSTTGQFSISQANSTTGGFLSDTDWNTFNNKQATITLTTTGTSGAATFTSNTLNIPQYQGALTLTTTGTSGAATLVGNTLNIPQYSGGSGTVSGTTNRIAKFTSSTAVGDSILREGTNAIGLDYAPSTWSYSALQINGAAFHGSPTETDAGITANAYYDTGWKYYANNYASQYRQINGEHTWSIAGIGTANNSVSFTTALRIDTSGNISVNTNTAGSRLQINGNAAIGYSASTAAPTNGLAVSGDVAIGTNTASTIAGYTGLTTNGTSGAYQFYQVNGSNVGRILSNSTDFYLDNVSTGNLIFRTNGASPTERMRITSGGTVIVGNGETAGTPALGIISGTGGTGSNIAGAEFRIRGGASTGSGAGGPITFYTSAAGSSGTGVNAATERMRLDASGNLGLGVTPSAWGAVLKSFDIGTSGSLVSSTSGAGGLSVARNGYYNGSVWVYKNTSTAQFYEQDAGQHAWYTAPSGTAGNTISFTQVMTLTASGNLGIGTTTIGSRLQVNGNAAIGYSASTAAPTNGLAVAGAATFGASAAAVSISNASDLWYNVTRGSSFTNVGVDATGSFYNTNTNHRFLTQNGVVTALTITSGGNVGLGTATIGSRLQVNGNAAIGYSASTAAPTNGLAVSGNVGIGIASATRNLDIRAADPGMTLRSSNTTGFCEIYFGDSAGEEGRILYGNNGDYMALYTLSTERMRITSGGEMQLKPTANTAALTTSGSYSLTGSNAQSLLDLAGTWNTTGNPTAIKLNITNTASGATADLMELQVGGVNQFAVGKTGSGYFKDMLTVEPQTANTGAIKTDGYSLTGSNAQALLSMTGTWNTTGNPTAISLNITNTASGASAYLMDLQVGGVTQFRVTKAGAIRTTAPTGGSAQDWKLGDGFTLSCGSPGTTAFTSTGIRVEVNGTTHIIPTIIDNWC